MSNIKGLDELISKLHALKGLSEHPKSLLAGAYVIERHAKEDGHIPVKTGFLRNSGESRQTDKGAEVAWMANYSYYIHEGTPKMPARPFLSIAIDEHDNEIVEAVGNQLEVEIQKVAKGG